MKSFDIQTGMEKLESETSNPSDPIERIIKRQTERKREERNGVDTSSIDEIEKFIENFNRKQKKIEQGFEETEKLSQELWPDHFNSLNNEIQDLQKFYSNSTFFLRIYDKKVCQKTLHSLQTQLQDIENRLMPKKKFGFKARKNKIESIQINNSADKVDSALRNEKIHLVEACGFCNRVGETLILENEAIEKKDVLLSDIKNCTVKLLGTPSTLHIANIESSHIYCGPVSTSVFIENVKDSSFELACQQLRVHNTVKTNFFVHVTSKAIIEDSTDVCFGIYKFTYPDVSKHFDISGLNKNINNWDKVDDFNWLASDKPSPNWTKVVASDDQD